MFKSLPQPYPKTPQQLAGEVPAVDLGRSAAPCVRSALERGLHATTLSLSLYFGPSRTLSS